MKSFIALYTMPCIVLYTISTSFIRAEASFKYVPIPMAFGVLIQWSKHDGKNNLHIVAYEVAEVFVVPEVQCALGDLEVRTSDRFGELMEQWLLDLSKLGRIHNLKNVFHFVEKHDLLGAVNLGPVAQQSKDNLELVNAAIVVELVRSTYIFGQGGILLEKLDNAVSQLWVVHAQALGLVEGQQDPRQEDLVFLLQGQSKAINDGAEYFEQLGDSVEPLSLVGKLEEDVVDGPPDERSQVEELAVDSVEGCL